MVMDRNGRAHEPAGTPHGGQFAGKSGAGADDDLEPDYDFDRARRTLPYHRYLDRIPPDDKATRDRVRGVMAAIDRLPAGHMPDDAQTRALAACADMAVTARMRGLDFDGVAGLPLTAEQAGVAFDLVHARFDPILSYDLRHSAWKPGRDRYVLMDGEGGFRGARRLSEDEYRAALWADRARLTGDALNVEGDPDKASDPRALDLMARAFA